MVRHQPRSTHICTKSTLPQLHTAAHRWATSAGHPHCWLSACRRKARGLTEPSQNTIAACCVTKGPPRDHHVTTTSSEPMLQNSRHKSEQHPTNCFIHTGTSTQHKRSRHCSHTAHTSQTQAEIKNRSTLP